MSEVASDEGVDQCESINLSEVFGLGPRVKLDSTS
jgi:hypothetical protein